MPQLSGQSSGIFIGYRRDDSSGHAVHLFDYLGEQLRGERVFMDIDMGAGEEFARKIEREVSSCEVFIALIGKQWLTLLSLKDEERQQRPDNPPDYVRLEIATALKGGKVVLPVLVDGARIPAAEGVPEDIAGLLSRQCFELRNQTWNDDARRLARHVKRKLDELRAEELARKKREAAEEERQRREAKRQARRAAEAAADAAVASRPVPKVNDSILIFSGVLQLLMIVAAAASLVAYLWAADGVPVVAKGETLVFVPRHFEAFPQYLDDKTKIDMEPIPGGWFLLGTPSGEAGPEAGSEVRPNEAEMPLHQARVESFYMAKFEVTQAQWRAVMGKEDNPSRFKGDNLPVENVSLFQAHKFCALLADMTKKEYRLPTEDEWEYAARAGEPGPFAFGRTLSPGQANFDGRFPYGDVPKGDPSNSTMPVGSYQKNKLELYDMHGNVWEWCDPSDSGGAGRGSGVRVLRGGAWDSPATSLRSGHRRITDPGSHDGPYGFRIVLDAR